MPTLGLYVTTETFASMPGQTLKGHYAKALCLMSYALCLRMVFTPGRYAPHYLARC